MHTRRLNRIARYLGSAGLYKEASQLKKLAENKDELEPLYDKDVKEFLDIIDRWKTDEQRRQDREFDRQLREQLQQRSGKG